MKIGILAIKYPIETSPFIKNICSYLKDKGVIVDIIVDKLYRDKTFQLSYAGIFKIMPEYEDKVYKTVYDPPEFSQNELLLLQNKIKNYDYIYCIEMHSLYYLSKTDFPFSKVIYCSLENEDILAKYNKDYVKKILSQCAFCINTAKERAENLMKYLDLKLKFEYLPVSLRPVKKHEKNIDVNNSIKIIYSGFFAKWACLSEFLGAYRYLKNNDNIHVTFHGHAIGTENYLNYLISEHISFKNLFFNTTYYYDDEYINYLSGYDIGLAFYKNMNQSSNWENLFFSSGKIASYLWAGLGVMTNINTFMTQNIPFIYIEDFSVTNIYKGLNRYLQNRSLFGQKALEIANTYYNLDLYMETIYNKQKLHSNKW